MSNIAAIIPAAKAPLEIRDVEMYSPGADEILVKNKVLALNPIEFKIAKLGTLPLQYPAILGSTLTGTVEAIGSQVKDFQVGETVVATRDPGTPGNQYGAYQRYVVVKDAVASKVPANVEAAVPASLIMNLTCVAGMFAGRLGLDKPSLEGSSSPGNKQKKILIYGGSSSFGSLAVQYLSQAGYTVITTTSPRHRDFVSKLGAAVVIDHTLESAALVDRLVAEGPYSVVADVISLPNTVAVTARVVATQGGGKLYTTQPAFGPETLPEGVTRIFESWPNSLFEEKDLALLKWVMKTYLPQGLSEGAITPLPTEKVEGGLKHINEAFDRLQKSTGGVRLVVDPWE